MRVQSKAKSVILSTRYDIGDEYLGKSKEELLAIGPLIAAGKYRFDDREVTVLASLRRAAVSGDRVALPESHSQQDRNWHIVDGQVRLESMARSSTRNAILAPGAPKVCAGSAGNAASQG